MRAYAPSIAQGEGRSLGEWRIRVFLAVPSPSIRTVKKPSYYIKVLQIEHLFQIGQKHLGAKLVISYYDFTVCVVMDWEALCLENLQVA